jgi:hypothetical protein
MHVNTQLSRVSCARMVRRRWRISFLIGNLHAAHNFALEHCISLHAILRTNTFNHATSEDSEKGDLGAKSPREIKHWTRAESFYWRHF